MSNVFVQPTRDGKFRVDIADGTKPLGPFETQAEASKTAKAGHHHSLVARVRHLNDKSVPGH